MFDCDEMFTSESDDSLPPRPIYDRYQSGDGYHVVPPPYTGTFMPPKPDLVFHNAPNVNETVHTSFNVELSPTKPNNDLSHTHRPLVHIIEDWISNSEDDSEAEIPQNAPSFVQPTEQVKTPRPSVKILETSIPAATPKIITPKLKSQRNYRNRKACFMCKSLTYLIKDCDYYEKKMAQTPSRNHAQKGNHQQYASMTLLISQKHVVLIGVLTKSKLVPITAARPITAAVLKPQGNPQHALKDKGVIDSGCSRHMTGNMSYLSEFEDLHGGYVAFGGNPNGGKISGKGKIRTRKLDFDDVYFVKELKFNLFSVSHMFDKKNSVLFTNTECLFLSLEFKLQDANQVLLRVPREINMYNVDLKNIVPFGYLTCLFAKATLDESNLWHKRKVDEGFLVGYSVSSKAFRVFNSRTRIVQETLHINFLENKPNVAGKEPKFEERKPESEVHVSLSNSAQEKKHDDKTKREAKVSAVGQISTNSTNTFSATGPSNTVVSPTHGKSLYVDTSQLPDDPNMLELEDITYSDNEEDVGAEADFTNLETTIIVSPIPTIKDHKDHPVTQIIGDLSSATQTRSMTRVAKDQGGLSQINNDDFHTCMFACFLSQKEPKRKVWVIVDFPNEIRAIGTKWVFRNKKDERGIVVGNKARLVAQGHTQEESIDYKEVFAPVARIEAIRLFLAYASFMRLMVYQIDVKSAFLYGTIEEEVYVCQPLGFEDPDYPDKVYKVVKELYGLHQAPRAFKRIFRYLKGKTRLGLWYPKDPPFNLVAYSDSDYAGASLDRKSTTRGCQFFKCRLISWQCKKQTVVATSSTKAEYVAAARCCTQVLWIQNQLLDYGLNVTAVSSSFCCLKINNVTRLHALVDKKKVIITEATIRDAFRLDDAECLDFLPNEEIFNELSRRGYEKPSTKLTFYKAFFSPQWKFLIHTILQCMSAKRTSEFSSSMASAVICLSTGRKFNFSKYIFDSLVRNVDSSTKFYMVGKGFSRLDTPLFEGIIVARHDDDVANEGAASVAVDDVPVVVHEPSIPSPTQPPTITRSTFHLTRGIIANIDADVDVTLKDVVVVAKEVEVQKTVEIEESADVQGRQAESQAQIYQIDLEHADKVLSMQDDELKPAELQEVVEVVTTAKLMTEVVTVASATITAADTLIIVVAPTLTTAPNATRRRKGVVIRDPEETATPSTIIHTEPKSKDKGKGIMIHEPKPLKKKNHIEHDETYARELEAELNKNVDWDEVIEQVQIKENEDNAVMRYQALKRKPQTEAQAKKNMMIYLRNMARFKIDYFKGMTYDDIRLIFEKKFNSNVAFLEKTRERMEEEDSKSLKRMSESQAEKAAKKQKLDEEVPVVDYEIYTENNKPYYKIIRADGSPHLFLSFQSLLRNFDKEDLEVLWQLVKDRFASSKPKNFLDDFLLTTLTYMFEKPDVQA
uniref:Putative ribonuclease H-like domain-containing protein n=1 Tax=Tanacetum cinerariifolium TaxID=118510 RepID=A0A6L2KYK3_TANCI|nr:putative ribonuclease H-like domain-containing protein [Tanacetum cinerariifolium]